MVLPSFDYVEGGSELVTGLDVGENTQVRRDYLYSRSPLCFWICSVGLNDNL